MVKRFSVHSPLFQWSNTQIQVFDKISECSKGEWLFMVLSIAHCQIVMASDKKEKEKEYIFFIQDDKVNCMD